MPTAIRERVVCNEAVLERRVVREDRAAGREGRARMVGRMVVVVVRVEDWGLLVAMEI